MFIIMFIVLTLIYLYKITYYYNLYVKTLKNNYNVYLAYNMYLVYNMYLAYNADL